MEAAKSAPTAAATTTTDPASSDPATDNGGEALETKNQKLEAELKALNEVRLLFLMV